MSGAGLVVHQGSLEEMEAALTAAHATITDAVTTALDDADSQMRGWDRSTDSRAAQDDYQRRLREGVERLTAALEAVRVAVADVREDARATEVKNVALLRE